MVAVGSALGIKDRVQIPKPEGLQSDGYLPLKQLNTFIRQHLEVTRKVYYRRYERHLLSDWLRENTEKAVVCVLGHYIYVDGRTYYSFFNNDRDPVVCVWYLKES